MKQICETHRATKKKHRTHIETQRRTNIETTKYHKIAKDGEIVDALGDSEAILQVIDRPFDEACHCQAIEEGSP